MFIVVESLNVLVILAYQQLLFDKGGRDLSMLQHHSSQTTSPVVLGQTSAASQIQEDRRSPFPVALLASPAHQNTRTTTTVGKSIIYLLLYYNGYSKGEDLKNIYIYWVFHSNFMFRWPEFKSLFEWCLLSFHCSINDFYRTWYLD